LNAVEHSGEDLETALQFFLSFRGRHEVTAICTFMNFDARDVDLPTGEYERVCSGAALEDISTALLAGTRFGHEGKCPVKSEILQRILSEARRCAGALWAAQAARLRGAMLVAAVSV
jgi:hypothetical protein